jgi:K(+)-stimulated pyrophosphate-energized sodium pump
MAIYSIVTLYLAIVASILSVVLSIFLRRRVMAAEDGNEDMRRVAGYIKEGAYAFLKRQYTTLAIVVGVLAVVIVLVYSFDTTSGLKPWWMVLCYLGGSISSGAAGWLGLVVGIHANSRTAQAATKGMPAAFSIAFWGGAVMGLLVTGLALTGVWIIFMVSPATVGPEYILGFSFGASSIALFAKAGGGIYTKTADVGADLVGKIEYTLPEDDPRNPASVADNVGDNVGDIAGMGCDLFDSYVASLLAAMILCYEAFGGVLGQTFAAYPMIISAAGLFASLIGILILNKFVTTSPGKALNLGTLMATILYIVISALLTLFTVLQVPELWIRLWSNWGAGVAGVAIGLMIGLTTDYFTDDTKSPTQKTAEAAQQGHALVILTGFSYGLLSVAPPVIGVVAAMAISYALDGVVGVANASVGMLAIVGTIVSNDAYGPITDNSRGLAEQGHLSEEIVAICDSLDSAGNTAKAVTKGFAIGAAALTVLALLYSYQELAGFLDLDILDPIVMIGLLLGAAIPPVYSAILIGAVNRNAQLMVKEIRRQFQENPQIIEGNAPADYAKCVDIATKGALKELIIPVILAIGAPIITGLLFGARALGAFLAASIVTGLVFALLMSNAGGMWDNAKKFIEDGHFGGKGTLAHAAAVTGDTVGDPFKDTAGPSINTLITVMSLTASMFYVLFANPLIVLG